MHAFSHYFYYDDAPFEIPGQCALSGTETETERNVETWVYRLAECVAARTAHVALEHTAKRTVHDAVAFEACGPARAPMCRIQQRDQTLVCILLRVPRQRPGSTPSGRKQGGRAECGLWRRWGMRGCEKPVELAACAVFFVFAPSGVVLVSEEVVPQERVVEECLEGRVEETCLS